MTPKERLTLEEYLFELEKYLQRLPPSKRSKYIADNHDHIAQTLEKEDHKSLEQILLDLGTPAQLANHLLLDHGLETYSPKKKISVAKWFLIIFLSSSALFFISIAILVWSFTPIFKVDEKNNRVQMFGGMIDVNATSGRIKVGNQYHFVQNRYTHSFDGALDINKKQTDEVVVNFNSGVIEISTSEDNKLAWNCKLETEPNKDIINLTEEIVEIDLEKIGGHSCEIQIPADMKVTLDGDNGQITLLEVEYDTFIDMKNGQVHIQPNPEFEYKYDLRIDNGPKDDFDSKDSTEAFEIKVYLENGTIKRSM